MSLTSALGIAQRSLLNTGRQTSVVSRNLAEQGNADYARRSANIENQGGGLRTVVIQRTTNEVLFKQNLAALSSSSGQQALLNGLNQLATSVQGASQDTTVAGAVGKLQEALTIYAAAPSNRTLALSAVEAARNVVTSLNGATHSVQTARGEADAQIASDVNELNRLLVQFTEVNRAVTTGTRANSDINDVLDQRDKLLKQISAIVPVSASARADGDMSLTTRDGVVLFDKSARPVTFSQTNTYDAAAAGSRVYIDGVPLGAASPGDARGSLSALLYLRDDVAPTLQRQFDEMARAIVDTFAVGGAAGLVTWTGSAVPGDAGFAGLIRLNASYDANAGGNPELLRGAGLAASDSTQIQSFISKLDAPFSFSATAGLGDGARTLGDFATTSISWLEGQRQSASETLESKSALATRTAAALSNAVGVNIDEEMALLLDLEHSYQASARLIKAVDEMLTSLLSAVR